MKPGSRALWLTHAEAAGLVRALSSSRQAVEEQRRHPDLMDRLLDLAVPRVAPTCTAHDAQGATPHEACDKAVG